MPAANPLIPAPMMIVSYIVNHYLVALTSVVEILERLLVTMFPSHLREGGRRPDAGTLDQEFKDLANAFVASIPSPRPSPKGEGA